MKNNIIENNELMSSFLGVYYKRGMAYSKSGVEMLHLRCWTSKKAKRMFLEQAKFHKSFDWLIPVWKKFRETIFKTDDTHLMYVFREINEDFQREINNNDPQNASMILAEGIKMYNEKNSIMEECASCGVKHYPDDLENDWCMKCLNDERDLYEQDFDEETETT